jgi:large subunit ribosomal protein L18
VSIDKRIAQRTVRRRKRVRHKISQSDLPRVSVFRSLSNIYVQLIDDSQDKTIASCSSLSLLKSDLKDFKGDKKEMAFNVGKKLAEKALDHGIKAAVFDRGQYLYHGRVKSLAEGLREAGLNI